VKVFAIDGLPVTGESTTFRGQVAFLVVSQSDRALFFCSPTGAFLPGHTR